MRALDRGDSFVITRNGVPVGELRPIERRRSVPAALAMAMFRGTPAIDSQRFRADVDGVLDQDIEPRV